MRLRRPGTVMFLAVLLFAPASRGQEAPPTPKVGSSIHILPLEPAPRPGHPPLVMREGSSLGNIRKIEGEWVLVKIFLSDREGWMRADETGTREQALAKANEALKKNPDDVAWLIRRAWMTMGPTYDNSLIDIERAIRLDEKRPMAFLGRGYIHSVRREIDLALDDYDWAIGIDPGDSRSYFYRAQTEESSGDLDGALDDYREAIRLNPTDMLPYSRRARLWARRGKPEKEMAEFDEAIRRNSERAVPFSFRSNAWLNRKEYTRALADANEAIRLEPNFDGGYLVKATVCRAMNDRENEIAALTSAVERVAVLPSIPYRQRAQAYSATGQNALAIKDLTEVIRLDPKFARSYFDRAVLWAKTDPDKAIADFDEAIRLDPKLVMAYDGRGVAWLNKGDLDRAIADFNEALRLDPNYATAYLHRGEAWQAKGKTEEMGADFAQAKRLGIDAPGPEPEAIPVPDVPKRVKADRVDPFLLGKANVGEALNLDAKQIAALKVLAERARIDIQQVFDHPQDVPGEWQFGSVRTEPVLDEWSRARPHC